MTTVKQRRTTTKAAGNLRRAESANQETRKMIARNENNTMSIGPDQEEPAAGHVGQQKRADSGQFRLQVDRQTKGSYATYEAAEKAGLAIKKSYPTLQVAIYDLAESVNKVLELPKVD